jgi:hypothetical protein
MNPSLLLILSMVVTLENSDGSQVYAKAEISGLTESWEVFERTLTATEGDPHARLVIAATASSTINHAGNIRARS